MQQRKLRQRLQQPPAIANDFNGIPPTRPPRLAVVNPPRKESLTRKFNRMAKHPRLTRHCQREKIQQQINAIRRDMSQPRATLEFGSKGSVRRASNPKRDRLLQRKITALQSQLQKTEIKPRRSLDRNRGLEGNRGLAKGQFMQANKGMGL